jgi:hypothetical protein
VDPGGADGLDRGDRPGPELPGLDQRPVEVAGERRDVARKPVGKAQGYCVDSTTYWATSAIS